MRDRLLSVFIFFLLISCSEENLPDGIYDYQVERLLTGQAGSKIWNQVINSTSCSDSLNLSFELAGDSVDVSRIDFSTSCTTPDTTYLGRANASSFPENDLFTDSLNFSDGDFWIVKRATSELLRIQVGSELIDYRYSD